jgi:uncharacterized membrane protein
MIYGPIVSWIFGFLFGVFSLSRYTTSLLTIDWFLRMSLGTGSNEEIEN